MSEAGFNGFTIDGSEEELRRSYIEDGNLGSMLELMQLYNKTGEKGKSAELMDTLI